MRTAIPWVVFAAALAALLAGHGHGGPAASSTTMRARVLRVVDGDTIKVRLEGGRTERVRYIGVDTPESVKPGTPVQCFAKAASAENERLVAGRRVRLVYDAERRDRYGRLLAYVYLPDGRMFNLLLAQRGYARPLTIPPNVEFADRFVAAARRAREAGRGLWSACQ